MTNEEAIKLLSNYFNWCPDCVDNEHAESHSRDCDKCMCKATKLAIEALEKQIPKKPTVYDCEFTMFKCDCGEELFMHHKYCPNCSQKIDWSDVNG